MQGVFLESEVGGVGEVGGAQMRQGVSKNRLLRRDKEVVAGWDFSD